MSPAYQEVTAMTDDTASDVPEGVKRLGAMGWEPLPYGCIGLVRKSSLGAKTAWSWLILIPWANRDAKPWVDGTKLFEHSLDPDEVQHAAVLTHMRAILDQRYGETIGQQAVESLLDEIQGGE